MKDARNKDDGQASSTAFIHVVYDVNQKLPDLMDKGSLIVVFPPLNAF